MVENDEDLLKGARPVVEAGAGQRWAGGALRLCGIVTFFCGSLGAMYVLMLGLMQWSRPETNNYMMVSARQR